MSGFTKTLMAVVKRQLAAASKAACEGGKKPPGTSTSKGSKGLARLHKLQKEYQRDDGKPIFLKRGLFDEILYRGTVGLAIIALGLDMKYYFGYILKD